ALVLEALATDGVSISQLRSRLSNYVMLRDRLRCEPRDIAPLLRLLRNRYQNEELDLTDGIKVLWENKWLQVRASSTEPIIRLVAEAPTEAEARSLLNEALEILAP
ncbi:MAG TPA: hypothetical protein PLP42_13815, partial [Acidobacteriota bacterium]|nr:hypothetical protein [Acidobacteriota bacterium]